MIDYVIATGEQIYQAAIEGAKRKFNRSTDDYKSYESMLEDFYNLMLDDPKNKEACESVRRRTKNNWRNANFPMTLLIFHEHRASQPCEVHARVCLMGNHQKVFDIPLSFWELLKHQGRKSA